MDNWNNFIPTREQLNTVVSDPDFYKKRGYVKVAEEGGKYKVLARTGVDVVYGAYANGANKYIMKKHDGSLSQEDRLIACNSHNFGKDPASGVKKACYARIVKDVREIKPSKKIITTTNNTESKSDNVSDETTENGKIGVTGIAMITGAVLAIGIVAFLVIRKK
jgi:hypothetical protein